TRGARRPTITRCSPRQVWSCLASSPPPPNRQLGKWRLDVVNKLIGVVSRVDDETSATAAAAFDSDVPRVAGHKATAEALKCLSDALDGWLKAWGASK